MNFIPLLVSDKRQGKTHSIADRCVYPINREKKIKSTFGWTQSPITIDKYNKHNDGIFFFRNNRSQKKWNKWKGMESNKKHLWSKNENLSTDNTGEIALLEVEWGEIFFFLSLLLFAVIHNGSDMRVRGQMNIATYHKLKWIELLSLSIKSLSLTWTKRNRFRFWHSIYLFFPFLLLDGNA